MDEFSRHGTNRGFDLPQPPVEPAFVVEVVLSETVRTASGIENLYLHANTEISLRGLPERAEGRRRVVEDACRKRSSSSVLYERPTGKCSEGIG